jgi:hypothetical protein
LKVSGENNSNSSTLDYGDKGDINDKGDDTLEAADNLNERENEGKEEKPSFIRVSSASSPSSPYRCYHNGCVCGHTCDFQTDSELEYQKHGAQNHIENPLLYPSRYEMKKYGLKPQGKPWETPRK